MALGPPGILPATAIGIEAVLAFGLAHCPAATVDRGCIPGRADLDQRTTYCGRKPAGDALKKTALVIIRADAKAIPVADDVEGTLQGDRVEVFVDHLHLSRLAELGQALRMRSEAGHGAPVELAVGAARKAVGLEPEKFYCRMGLGAALLRTGRSEVLPEAIEQLAEAERLRTAKALDSATSLPALQAIALVRLGRHAEARAALERARRQLTGVAAEDPELRLLVAEAEAAVAGR